MNKRLLVGIVSCVLLTIATFQSKAQFSISVNIGTQPVWGPVGYEQADYYYMPDIESYYSVSTHQFIYLNGGRWVYSTNLPPRYPNYDLYSGYKVVVNRPRPYLNFSQDRVTYARYKGYRGHQNVIRDSHDTRYKQVHYKPENQKDNHGHDDHHDNGQGHEDHHDNGHGHDDHHDNGHGNGHGNGNGHH